MNIISLHELLSNSLPLLVLKYYQVVAPEGRHETVYGITPSQQALMRNSIVAGKAMLDEQLQAFPDRLMQRPPQLELERMMDAAAEAGDPLEVLVHFVQALANAPELNQDIAYAAKRLQLELAEVQALQSGAQKAYQELQRYRLTAKALGIDLMVDMSALEQDLARVEERRASVHAAFHNAVEQLDIHA